MTTPPDTDLGSSEHLGFEGVLEELQRARSSAPAQEGGRKDSAGGVSPEVLGSLLRELAVAAPDGRLRSELQEVTHYSSGTLSKALTLLGDAGLITRLAFSAGPSGGRALELYVLGSDRWAAVGVAVVQHAGRAVGLVGSMRDLSGQPLRSHFCDLVQPTDDAENDWKYIADEIATLTKSLLREWQGDGAGRRLLGVGIQVPGHVHGGEVLLANHAGYRAFSKSEPAPLASRVSQQLGGITVVLDNDVNLIALRETYRPEARSRSSDGAVVAVFEQGVGAGLLANALVFRGSRGAAGEPGHVPVFGDAGDPRPSPGDAEPNADVEPVHRPLRFSDPCSCGKASHVDCYATPERLTAELGEARSSFDDLARLPARRADGTVTEAGRVFWTGGVALGLGIVSLLNIHNPGWLLLLLHKALARAQPEDGTAAGLYRQAVETIIDEHAFSSSALDARQDGPRLEVKALAGEDLESGEDRGADKAARNAAVRVVDEFVAHALQRDRCQPGRAPGPRPTWTADPQDRRQVRALQMELRAILRRYDPEQLLKDGQPVDEYAREEIHLAQMIIANDISRDRIKEEWGGIFSSQSRLLADDALLNNVVRAVAALKARWDNAGLDHSSRLAG